VRDVGDLFVCQGRVFTGCLEFIEIFLNVEKTLKVSKGVICLGFCKLGNSSTFATLVVTFVTQQKLSGLVLAIWFSAFVNTFVVHELKLFQE